MTLKKTLICISIASISVLSGFAKDLTNNQTIKEQRDTIAVACPKSNILPDNASSEMDSSYFSKKVIHQLNLDTRTNYIIQTHSFLRGENENHRPIDNAFSTHLKYSFRFHPQTYSGRIYKGAYQGIGVSRYYLKDEKELGSPIAVYLFQGATIAQLGRKHSFNYEWNFGLSGGWKHYDYEKNKYNQIIGSKLNAYLNTNFFFNWTISRQLDLTYGVTLTHFSNGNTEFPNSGLNTVGLKLGLTYKFNASDESKKQIYSSQIPKFKRHISYDLVLFGSWKRKGVEYNGDMIPAPNAYKVLGMTLSPMYNLGYKFRLGVALDGIYDRSANLYARENENGNEPDFVEVPTRAQMAMGISGRAEFVMPFFTIGIGIGGNVLYMGKDHKGWYQILALKMELTKSSFLHIGYNLKEFHTPNYLMLGVGYRFNNKRPTSYR